MSVKASNEENRKKLKLEWDLFQERIREIIKRLKINLKEALDDEDKKIKLIGDAFGKLNKEFQDFKSDIKKIIEGDWAEWEKFKKEL